MGLFDGLFGSSESTTELPDWVVGPAQEMLQRSVDMGKAGYMPWTGPSVAAIDRSQVAGMRNNQDMAAAFGMQTAMPNIMPATDYGNGVFGYSSMPLYEQNMATLQETRPGQMDYYNSFFVDPVTGVEGTRMQQSNLPTIMQDMLDNHTSPHEEARQNAWAQAHIDDVNSRNGTNGQGGLRGVLGNYTGLLDMINGGGPGASGANFGGLLGGISNGLGFSPIGGGDSGRNGARPDVGSNPNSGWGFDSIGDMFDGGGPGASGSTYGGGIWG